MHGGNRLRLHAHWVRLEKMNTRLVFLLCGALLAVDASKPLRAQDPLPAQRREFLAAAVSLAAGRQADYEARRQHLDDYVLAPYLDYALLRRDLRTLDARRAREFLDRESATQLGRQFRIEWLAELARREDWNTFLQFDPGDDSPGTTLRCQRLRARLGTGVAEQELRSEILAIWPTGKSLPDACDPALAVARKHGWLDTRALWERLRLAVDAGDAGLTTHLARQLPAGDERTHGERLARALSDPKATLAAAATWPDTAANREAAALALRRFAKPDVVAAIGQWHGLERRFDFDATQRAAILRELALYAAVAYRTDAEDWFQRVPADVRDQQLADWQLRAALARQAWSDVRDVANGLPRPLADSARPRYWRARALQELGDRQAAHDAFAALSTESNFHGFLAADRSNQPYSICPQEVAADPQRAAQLRRRTDLARALELHRVGWRSEAARAWDHDVAKLSEADRDQALILAAEQGWHDRAVFALNSGDHLRKYGLRFPVAQREQVERDALDNGIDPAWVFALIRAESAWQPDARSHADAHGLMQLLPGTARSMAQQLGVTWTGTSSLYQPEFNIRLGTRYLSQQASRFGNSPWLASAAYNAGPAPVQRWLSQRSDRPADVFIETIPYHETREYVARVLAFSVIYDWRLHGKVRPLSSRLPDPGQPYAGVPAPDRPVVCAAPALASAPSPGRQP
ncbi:hypothetical protein B1808_03600 [Pseudofulvimonas gallinarii]|uniref:Soluble lytic murein transglycosylase n=2 Tax=Pseudofulvimonas gallinarii TaxID=634155 RepID=A0A4V6NZD2_9GAMM|nr:soluble lytic murein transglycosylase [Pseudofulvimonas gallinarii]THD14359.1 hypothetical protein B1808_03600 [Pseudofulvimonas gallinarii]